MAEEEKQLLLDHFEDDAVDIVDPRRQINALYASDLRLGTEGPIVTQTNSVISITNGANYRNTSESDAIVAIFVVAFDTKAGNVVEWCIPENINLEGLEFKAMASGSHTLRKDFVYFRKGSYFGLACFENMPVESEVERGARMKSVGILTTSYTLLYRHMQFLEKQVGFLLDHRQQFIDTNGHQLQTPGKYSQLRAFWEDKKAVLARGLSHSESIQSLGIPAPVSTPQTEALPEMRVTHPAGCFNDFIHYFGEHIFILWKLTLLRKRILFFSPPPIGSVCYRVYCTCCLATLTLQHGLEYKRATPHFYVNVADIDTLESEVSYIACTTEKIFETKPKLYDVYVDEGDLKTSANSLRSVLVPSNADRDKLQKLNNHRSSVQFSTQCGDRNIDDEAIFAAFFTEQNNRLFQTLLDVAASQDRTLTSEHLTAMGLDPQGDRAFIMELVETHGIDVMLLVDNPCCPR